MMSARPTATMEPPIAAVRGTDTSGDGRLRSKADKKSKRKGGKGSKNNKSPTKEERKQEENKRSKVRNDKAKSAGMRIGALFRSSLSVSRHRSKSLGKTPEAGTISSTNISVKKSASCDSDEHITKSNRKLSGNSPSPRSFDSRNGEEYLDMNRSFGSRTSRQSGEEMLNRSAHSFVSCGGSQRSVYSLSEGDVEDDTWPINASERSPPDTRTESKAHTEARERLIIESQRAIERKQQQARLKQRCSQQEKFHNDSSRSLSSISWKPTSVSSRSLSLDRERLSHSLHSPKTVSVDGTKSMSVRTRHDATVANNLRTRSSSPKQTTIKNANNISFNVQPLRRIQSMAEPKIVCNSPTQGKPFSRSSSKSPSRRFAALFLRQREDKKAEDSQDWHGAIIRHKWDLVEEMLRSYDHTLYKKSRVTEPTTHLGTPKRSEGRFNHVNIEGSRPVSPLLHVDSNGQTPLHLACTEHMPQKLLRRLLFAERGAASVQDEDGRFPLHVALINGVEKQLVDRLIHAYPRSLGLPDKLSHTPIQYGVLKAEYLRDKTLEVNWSTPTTHPQIFWQRHQQEAWENVAFVLEAMISRQKPLSLLHERSVLIDSVNFFAPPAVVNQLITVGGRSLLEDAEMSEILMEKVLRLRYPIFIIKRVMKITSKILPTPVMLRVIRQGLVNHFKEGCVEGSAEGIINKSQSTFGKELIHYYRSKEAGRPSLFSVACKEWWDKLRFLVAHASCRFDDDTDDIILHAALTNPASPPCLIEFLCRLFPTARYEIDVRTGGLPLHLACMYWNPLGSGDQSESDYIRVIHLLTAGDACLLQSRCKNRLPLHHAIATVKPVPFIQALLVLDKTAVVVPDTRTMLFPFQLAAIPFKGPHSVDPNNEALTRDIRDQGSSSDDVQKLELIYELLKINPFSISVLMDCQSDDMTVLTRHILLWCYDWSISGWRLNTVRKDILRSAIRHGKVPVPMKSWWSTLKTLIWRASNDLVDERGQNPMCDTPQTRDYLLHAALWNGDKIPPIVIELILELYPSSVFLQLPGTGLYPLQIAARSPSYRPFSFEKAISMDSGLEMISLIHGNVQSANSKNGRLPIQEAIWSGKTWSEVRSLAKSAPDTLLVADPISGLFPFQAAACKGSFLPKHVIVQSYCSDTQWAKSSPAENSHSLKVICQSYDLEKLTTIFEILRTTPTAILPR
ncbi:ankyrin repeat domain protein [Nitzschia inconspicua]|uniref:Ankyrin repeat domain protein n=1 Tax=Nitzschia inconspicua TaxID=303405 RepID=A0A9K3Q3K4_9STRA|nr:ankyrin repeat domain protein [Nitzschia inconspicua]